MAGEQQPQAPAPGSPEHDAAMAAKYDAAQGVTPPVDGQPQGEALILGKFKSQEDLAKAYTELEKRLGKPADPPQAPATPPEGTPTPPEGTPTPPPAPGKVDWQAIGTEVSKDGALSEASRKALTDMGIPPEVIDGYVSSQQRAVSDFKSALAQAAGGEEQFETIRTWAAANLSEAEKTALQKMVEQGVDTAKMAVATMKARFEAANGAPPVSPVGGKAPGSTSVGYGSTAEMMRDMADPRYAKDAAFRKSVEDKLAATTAF